MFHSQVRKCVGNILIVSDIFRKQCKINIKVTDTAGINKLLQKVHHSEKCKLSVFVCILS